MHISTKSRDYFSSPTPVWWAKCTSAPYPEVIFPHLPDMYWGFIIKFLLMVDPVGLERGFLVLFSLQWHSVRYSSSIRVHIAFLGLIIVFWSTESGLIVLAFWPHWPSSNIFGWLEQIGKFLSAMIGKHIRIQLILIPLQTISNGRTSSISTAVRRPSLTSLSLL